MRNLFKCVCLLVATLLATGAAAEDLMTEDFETHPETRWRFFTDGVMGGVSVGQLTFEREDGQAHARMTGRVSTENNGGFIQMRLSLPDGATDGARGVRLVVRGNDQRYFVHLRTNATRLPWQYYQAGFKVTNDWQELHLPLEAFEPSDRHPGGAIDEETITSIAVAAFGRDHAAAIDVREIGFY